MLILRNRKKHLAASCIINLSRTWMDDGKGDNGDDRLSSFNPTFVINREKDWEAGHGLDFLIAPNVSTPKASYGQWIGLTNASTDGNTSANHFVAIEFDAEKQDGIDDPDDNHIEFNINSINSIKKCLFLTNIISHSLLIHRTAPSDDGVVCK